MLHDPDKPTSVAVPAQTPNRLLDVIWGANFVSPLIYTALALLLGPTEPDSPPDLFLLPYVLGAVTAISAVTAQVLWRRWSPADLPVHRARARAADLPILRARLVQVWALDSLAGVFGIALALTGFPQDVWIWFMVAPAALLFLHHPAHLRLAETIG
jgi:hypothetical protein